MKKIILNKNISFRDIEGEVFIFNRQQSKIHTFNATGNFILKQLLNNKTYNEILQSITEEFEITEENAKKDLNKFLQKLKSENLIIISEA